MWWTSTSNIDFSTLSGSIPWLIVRLPCGSRSMQRTSMAGLGEGDREVEGGRRLRDAALLVGEGDHLGAPVAGCLLGRDGRGRRPRRADRRDRLAGGDPRSSSRSGSGTGVRPAEASAALDRVSASGSRPAASGSAGSSATGCSSAGSSATGSSSAGSSATVRSGVGSSASGCSSAGSSNTGSGRVGRRARRPCVPPGSRSGSPADDHLPRSAVEKTHCSRLFARG